MHKIKGSFFLNRYKFQLFWIIFFSYFLIPKNDTIKNFSTKNTLKESCVIKLLHKYILSEVDFFEIFRLWAQGFKSKRSEKVRAFLYLDDFNIANICYARFMMIRQFFHGA